MKRANNFYKPVVEKLLVNGCVNFDPFTNELIDNKYMYVLEHLDAIPVDQTNAGDYIETLEALKDVYYNKYFTDDSYKHNFAFQINAVEYNYETAIVVFTESLDETLIELCEEYYVEEEYDIDDYVDEDDLENTEDEND
jgi:hypothetical protein